MTRMHVHVRVPDSSDDFELELADADVTVSEVFDALDLPLDTEVDGQPIVAPASVRAVDVMVAGSQLRSRAVVIDKTASTPATNVGQDATVDVSVIAGLDAGRMTQLSLGDYLIDDRWLLRVAPPRQTGDVVQPAGWHVHGSLVEAVMEEGAAIAMSPPIAVEPLSGRAVHRPPRHVGGDVVAPINLLEAPSAVKLPAPLSWSTLLTPIPIALMMAFFFRPIFALFAAMGPVMALGRWFESKRRYRREVAVRAMQVQEVRASLDAALQEQAEAVAQLRWRSQPHVGELFRRARDRSVRLWERRPMAASYLEFAIGVGPDCVAPSASSELKPDPVVHRALDDPLTIRPVPHLVDLQEDLGLGVHGEREAALAVVRSAVLQLATLHGPADLKIGVVCDQAAQGDWDWLKWLPHIDTTLTAASCAPLAKRIAQATPPSSSTGSTPAPAVRVIVVDQPQGDVASIQRAARAVGLEVRFLVVAPLVTALPAVCSALVQMTGAAAEVSTDQLTGVRSHICPIGVASATASSWARSLSAMIDPEVTDAGGTTEDSVSLLGLVPSHTADELAQRWAQRPVDAAAVAPIGLSDDGSFLINLSDDGPHGLIAGTTGSGKSELLRTLVVGLAADSPPDLLNFVLIDFKGGGAFDAVARLPHVAGMITDLDEALVSRAIASLRSELHRRETLFRELGVASFEEALRQAVEPSERLVVVIDEFATLATEYADLMSAFVDMAARGRSLGMHLVLATQRPSGVVDQKIRANTNLRVALRVQDPLDSHDVVGTGAAAAIDRRVPGRAIVSVGGDAPVTVQTAFSGAIDNTAARCAVTPHRLFGGTEAPTVGATSDTKPATELQVLVDAIRAASAHHGPARQLWHAPLPERLDWIDLAAHDLGSSHLAAGVALGLEDVPDLQVQRSWRWNLDSGPLALYSASASCAAKVLVAVGAALASTNDPEAVHLYVVDGDAGRALALQNLTHTGAYITLTETDRIERVITFFEDQLAARRTAPGPDSSGANDPSAVDQRTPRLVLMVDNIAAVLSTLGEAQALQVVDRLSAIARDGTPQRIHVVVTARTVRDIGHRLSQQFPNRLALALADMSGYLTLGLKARDVPVLPAMRAIDLTTRHLVQLVEPPDLTTWTAQVGSCGPEPIREFPDRFDAGALGPATYLDQILRIPVGIEAERLEHVDLVLRGGEHALIAVGNGMGRSQVVQLIVQQLEPMRDELDVIEGAGFDAATLANATKPVVVVIDDADRLDAASTKSLEALLEGAHPHVRVIAATTPRHARSVRSWVARVRAAGVGVLIGGSAGDGDLFGTRLGPVAGLGRLPGRGYVIGRGRAAATQFAAVGPSPNAPMVNE